MEMIALTMIVMIVDLAKKLQLLMMMLVVLTEMVTPKNHTITTNYNPHTLPS